MGKIGFHAWIKLQSTNSNDCQERIRAIPEYERDNAWIAAQLAYDDGVKEGKRQAGETILELITK